MKKVVAILLTIFMLFNCVSCDFLKSHIFKHKTTAGDTTKKVESGTEFRSGCDLDIFECESLEEYYELLAQYEIPDDFVRYEQLQELGVGEFKFFSVTINNVSYFDGYMYRVVKDDHTFQLNFYSDPDNKSLYTFHSYEIPIYTHPSMDLRSYDLTSYVNDEKYSTALKANYVLSYIKDQTKYTYTGNYDNTKRLNNIEWYTQQGVFIKLTGIFYDYPEKDDWINLMLNNNTIVEGKKKFDAMRAKLG